MMQHI